jgi:hypothetical protein
VSDQAGLRVGLATMDKDAFWTIRAREAFTHASMVALLLWTAAILNTVTGSGIHSLAGPLKGGDFVHFYTLGRAAWLRPAPLYDQRLQHNLQGIAVPGSQDSSFIPVYPPQVALLFAPLARLSYRSAALIWAVVTLTVYGLCVYAAWRRWRNVLRDRRLVVAAAAGSAPIGYLALNGQTTPIILVAFAGAWLALEMERRWIAGLVLGGLAIKPQFGIVLAVVLLTCGEWQMLWGLVISIAVQVGVTAWLLGPSVWSDYLYTLVHLPDIAGYLEPRPFLLHSLQAWTRLLPSPWRTGVWVIAAGFVCWQSVRVWRTSAPIAVRLGVLILATVFISPHLTLYDATVLVLPVLLIGGWLEQEGGSAPRQWWSGVYWLSVTLLFPTALVVSVQVSVVFVLWLLVQAVRQTLSLNSPSIRVACPPHQPS